MDNNSTDPMLRDDNVEDIKYKNSTKPPGGTYKVYVYCGNCSYGDNDGHVKKFGDVKEDVFLEISKGTLFDYHKATAICQNCGCKGTFVRKR